MTLHLSPREVTAVRHLLMVDDTDYPARVRALLGCLHLLIPSESLGLGIADRKGFLEFHIDLPDLFADLGPQVCDGPLHVGLEHLAASRSDAEELAWLARFGIRDCLRVGFPLGGGRVVQIYFDRFARCFEPRDVALLGMLQPALARQVRPPHRTGALERLSGAERRVLALVAGGASNQDVAHQLAVSEATVRKHLEHTYRKLGVANRTAAAALLRAGAPA